MHRCRNVFRTFLFLAFLVPFLIPSGAFASHETVVIDGDLTDLITAVDNNLGSSNGGFKAPGALGNIYSVSCAFVNGFDIRNNYALFDFKDAMGNYTPDDITLYLGWEVEGTVGDVDGDGSASTYTANGNFTCANNGDQAGIGPFEAYKTFIDLDCDFVPDVTLCIMNNQIVKEPATAIPGAEMVFNGKFLEVKIPNFQNFLPAGMGLCEANLILTANSQFDGLGEDSSPQFQLRVDPSISVTKTPSVQDACAGQDVSWTVTVKNDGLCLLGQVNVSDMLSAGMTFVSSNPASMGDTQNRTWTFFDLAPGDSIEISLTANLTKPCTTETHTNHVDVEATHDSNCTKGTGVTGSADATVNCRTTPCDVSGDLNVCVGNTKTYSTTVTSPFSRAWSVTSTPPGICNTIGALDGPSVEVHFTGAGACTVSLLVTDPLNPDACQETCNQIVTVHDQPPCDITGDPSACIGDTKSFSTTAGAEYTRTWSVTSTPAGICNTVGGNTGGSIMVNFTGAGTCTVSLTVTDPNDPTDCTTTCTHNVTVVATPTCNIDGPADFCGGASGLIFTVESNPPGGDFSWQIAGDGTIDGSTTGSSVSVTAGASGSFTLTVTVTIGDCTNTCELERSFVSCEVEPSLCWMTGGGCIVEKGTKKGHKDHTFGGNVGPPPTGSWEHIVRQGNKILFNFHSYDSHVDSCWADDGPGPCSPHHETQNIVWSGTGVYSAGTGQREFDGTFVGYVQDRSEGQCGSTDYYEITVYNTSGGVVFHVGQEIDCGNMQLHELKGKFVGDETPLTPAGAFGQLEAAVPNPFRTTTSVHYYVDGESSQPVNISVYDVTGRLVRTVDDGFRYPGEYEATWDGRGDEGGTVASGIYFIRVVSGSRQAITRVLFTK